MMIFPSLVWLQLAHQVSCLLSNKNHILVSHIQKENDTINKVLELFSSPLVIMIQNATEVSGKCISYFYLINRYKYA